MALFLALFVGTQHPSVFGMQSPSGRLIYLDKVATSKGYCDDQAGQAWPVDKVKKEIIAFGLAHATFSRALAWPYVYLLPKQPADLVKQAFDEPTNRWLSILNNAYNHAKDVCVEIYPDKDLHDGRTNEAF
jgi:hypothetical protein